MAEYVIRKRCICSER